MMPVFDAVLHLAGLESREGLPLEGPVPVLGFGIGRGA